MLRSCTALHIFFDILGVMREVLNTIFTLPIVLCILVSSSFGNETKAQNKPLSRQDHVAAEQRLNDLGYWTGKVDGNWDSVSRSALMAFQKVEGLKRAGTINRNIFNKLMSADRPRPKETGPAHIEVDLDRQVLFLTDNSGEVVTILPVSTGSGKPFKSQGYTRDAITWPGRYKIFIKVPGWKKGPLGSMYYPSYFMWGTAIHGYQSVPNKPASHGCVRIPMFAAKQFFKIAPMGMEVLIYKEGSVLKH